MIETQTAFMAAAIGAGLWLAVLTQRRDGAGLRYSVLALSFAVWATGRGAVALGLSWGTSACLVGGVLVGPAALSFSRSLSLRPRTFAGLDLVLCLSLLAPLVAIGSGLQSSAIALRGAGVWALAWGIVAGRALWIQRSALIEKETPEAERMRYLILCQFLLGGGIALDTLLWLFAAPPIFTLLTALPYLYVGYLILARVPLADVRQLLGHALSLAALAGTLAGFFALLHIWVGARIDLFVFNAFIASVGLLLAFTWLGDRFRQILDRWFVASKVALERTLLELERRLPQLLTLDSLLSELLRTLERTDRVTSSAIYLREDPRVGFQQVASLALPPRSRINLIRDPIFTEALEAESVLQRADLGEELEEAIKHPSGGRGDRAGKLQALCRTLDGLDAQIVLPLRAGERVVGFWTLTNARAHEPFSTAEIDLLRSVADLAGRGIENSKTFEQVRARDRLASLGEMSAGLAHELRNPLATIRAAVEVLSQQSNGNSREPDEFRDVIIEETARLDRVLSAFLDYARPSTRRTRVEDIGECIRECISGITRGHTQQSAELNLEITPNLPAITLDTDQLERVLMNVVHNAYEALSDGGQIRVAVGPHQGGIEIRVQDDGPGMDEATLERVFVPFYTRKDSGTGLGLALCERIMRSHGGEISIRSRTGEGTAVSLHFPGTETAVHNSKLDNLRLDAPLSPGEGA